VGLAQKPLLPKGIPDVISSLSERAASGNLTDSRPDLAIAVKPNVGGAPIKVKGSMLLI